jgi:O-antigen/teichoic acid export membrane protein
VLGRWLGWAVSRGLALSCLSTYQKRAAAFSGREASALFAFAGWVTLSSLLTPVFLQADRFVIGAMISASAVTTYVVPHELVVQTLVVVGAFSSVFFPTLSAMVRGPEAEWRPYYLRWALRLLAAMAGLLCMLAIALPHILQLWLGQMVSAESWEVGRILCLGVFFGAVGSVFFALLHARGRPDLTAKAHLIELPVFLFVLQASVMQHGISGAAWAWTLRMGFDAVLLALAARRV